MNPDDLTLEQLGKSLGTPAPELLEAIAPPEAHDDLIDVGRQIKSSRIITDVRRIYALAFTVWSKATDEQKDALVGFSPELLALGVDRALALDKITADTGDAEELDAATLKHRQTEARVAFQRGLTLRDHAERALARIAGRDPVLRARLQTALGTAEDAAALVKGIERLVALGKEWLAVPTGPISARAKLARLSPAYLDKLSQAGETVKTTSAAATGRATTSKTSQGEIDLLDGINIHILGEIVHAFDAAHEVDATIPRLVPIATRRLLGKRNGTAKPAEKPAATPA
ncbi:hypothetical protein A7982_12465 [Minicystis rosea]|nr:hypothetical protein A7982_12465 [Minicystis rosea]